MPGRELSSFLSTWSREAEKTLQLLRALPADQYDFRPLPGWRSIGELAWHLAEGDGYVAEGVAKGKLDFSTKIPGLERPRTIPEVVTGYTRVHADCIAKVKQLKPEDMDRMIPSYDGSPIRIGDMLWNMILHHTLHHRGELVLMCRMAGGKPPGLYGPNMEETAAMRAAQGA